MNPLTRKHARCRNMGTRTPHGKRFARPGNSYSLLKNTKAKLKNKKSRDTKLRNLHKKLK